MEGARLDGGNTFVDQLRAAIHQPGFLGAELQGLARNLVVVGLVRLAEVRGIGKDAGAFLLHPQQRRAGVEAARESDADVFSFWQAVQNRTHKTSNRLNFDWCANIKFRADGHAFNSVDMVNVA